MPADYTSQLQEIVRALNRPQTPTWLIALFSGVIGFLAAVLGQIVQHWYAERSARTKMRMIIYSEFGSMYSRLVHFHTLGASHKADQNNIEWRKRQLRERFLKFEGEKYAEDNKGVFIQLKEHSTISLIYSAIHDVFLPEEDLGFFINSGLAIEILEDCVRLNDLPELYVRRYMNGSDVAAIAKSNKRRLEHSQAKG
jgi:hypothetical protein